MYERLLDNNYTHILWSTSVKIVILSKIIKKMKRNLTLKIWQNLFSI